MVAVPLLPSEVQSYQTSGLAADKPQVPAPSLVAPVVVPGVATPEVIGVALPQPSLAGAPPPPQLQLTVSATASPAQMLSHAVSQQNGSAAQIAAQHAGWLQPGPLPATQQSLVLVPQAGGP